MSLLKTELTLNSGTQFSLHTKQRASVMVTILWITYKKENLCLSWESYVTPKGSMCAQCRLSVLSTHKNQCVLQCERSGYTQTRNCHWQIYCFWCSVHPRFDIHTTAMCRFVVNLRIWKEHTRKRWRYILRHYISNSVELPLFNYLCARVYC